MCAIYILIAGSYTPFLMIIQPVHWLKLLTFIWVCSLAGILVEAILPLWKHKPKFSLTMYLGKFVYLLYSCLFPTLASYCLSCRNGLDLFDLFGRLGCGFTNKCGLLCGSWWRGIYRRSTFFCTKQQFRSLYMALLCTSGIYLSLAMRVSICGESLMNRMIK